MANPLLRVMRWGTPNKYIECEAGATNGADLGVNIRLNGVLLRPEDVLNPDPSGETQFPITLWRNVLEIPPNVTALAETNTTGLYVITGPGGSETRTLIEGVNVDIVNPDGVAGNPTISMPAAGDGSTARKPIQYNADVADTLGADAGFTYDPTVGVKLLENEGPASFRAITDAATLGATLVTNGTFTGSATGWTLGAGWAYGTDNVVFTVGGAGTLSQSIAVTSGNTYLVSWSQQHSVSNSATITPSIGAAAGLATSYNNTIANTQTQVIQATASGSLPLTFTAVTVAGGGTVTIDTVSVQEITTVPFTIEMENAAGATVHQARAFTFASNLANGNLAGESMTSGSNDTFVGSQAGRANTTGSSNTFLGSGAGFSNTTASNNTFIGRDAGRTNTTAANNTYIGQMAGGSSGTGGSNTAVGVQAGQVNSVGTNNAFLGFQAGLANTTGSSNTFDGSLAGASNLSGSLNTFIGRSAGQFQADGVTALTTATNSVYVGANTRGLNNSDSNSIAVGFQAIGRGPNTAQWGNTSMVAHYFTGTINMGELVIVESKAGLPMPVAGVITLANNVEYRFTNVVDLTGDRIVCGTNNVISGSSFASSGITSTGLAGASNLITVTSSLSMRNIAFPMTTGQWISANDGATGNLEIEGVAVTNVATLGTIQNYGNVVVNKSIFQNSANLTIDGTLGAVVIETSLLDGRTGATTITVPSTAVIARRFRVFGTSFTNAVGETAINFSASATVPDESYILDNVNFSGGSATFLAGLDYTSNKASFFRNFGIRNSNAIASYSMTGNATATVIAVASDFVKIAGTTVAGVLNQKFTTAVSNQAVYTGAFTADFRIAVNASMTSGNNQTLRMRVAKNGVTLTDSNVLFQTTGSGEASAIPTQALVTLAPTDYLEVFVTNDTAANNITVSDLNVTIIRLES